MSYFSIENKKSSKNSYLTENSNIIDLEKEYSWQKIRMRENILKNFVNY